MRVYVIAANTFREAVRDRLIFGLLVAGVILISLSILAAKLSFVQEFKVMADIGLAVITLMGMVMAVFTGAGLFTRETEQRRIYSILSKPVPRYQLVLGKYLGTVFALTVNLVLMTLYLLVFLLVFAGEWAPGVLKAALMIEFELAVIAAMALFFASFTTSVLSIFYSAMLFVACHMLEDIRTYFVAESAFGRAVSRVVYYLLPNLENFNIKQEVVHGLPVAAGHIASAAVYAVVYIAVLMCAAMFIFRNRDLE